MTTSKTAPKKLPKEQIHLSPKELAERWRGRVSFKTLQQWRWKKVGPPFIKVNGTRVLYPVDAIREYESAQLVSSALKGAKK